MDIYEPKKVIYTAQSRHLFYSRMLVCKYVFEKNAVPLNPFNVWGYFLDDLVDRDLVRQGNNNILRIVDEAWIFGPISNGVLAEIDYIIKLNKPLKFFSVGPHIDDIKPISIANLTFEPDALINTRSEEIKERINQHLASLVTEQHVVHCL